MKNTALILAGPIISILAAWLATRKKGTVADWMNDRKIVVQKKVIDKIKLCNICNSQMTKREKYTVKKTIVFYWLCTHYPKCRKTERYEE